MKVLWITIILFPEAVNILSKSNESLKNSGGWLLSSAQGLVKNGGVELVVASPTTLVTKSISIKGEDITYYAIPAKYEHHTDASLEAVWKAIVDAEHPDLVHIHGTEYSHGLGFLNANLGVKTIVSMQGVVSAIGQYYLEGLSNWDIIRNTSLMELFYTGTLFKRKKQYLKRGREVEYQYLLKADYVIGRTSFDKAWINYLNPQAKYIFCNESLRNEFYKSIWSYESCCKHSIFLSQVGYPVKGFHQVLKALPKIIEKYPDTVVRIAGANIIKASSFKSKLLKSSYARIIENLINKYNLVNSIEFLGNLDAEQMKNEYLRCNVFICPSTVENSPNSLGEAQVLGVPTVASFVGGVPDFIPSQKYGGVYRFDDTPAMVKVVCDVFANQDSYDRNEIRQMALERHNREVNRERLISIYKSVAK